MQKTQHTLKIIFFLCIFFSTAIAQNKVDEGIKLFDAEKYVAAEEIFAKMVQSNPNDSQANYYLGRIYFNLGMQDHALKYLEKAVAIDEGNIDYHLSLAEVYSAKTRNASFLAAGKWAGKWKGELEKAFEIDPKNLDARRRLINYLLNAPAIGGGDKEKGKKLAEETIALDEIQGRLLLAYAYRKHNQIEQAVAEYEKVLSLDPKNGAAYNALGYTFLRQKDYAAAEQNFKKQIAVTPDDPNAYDSLGDCYAERGRMDEAMALFQKALQTDSTFSASRFKLAQAYEKKQMPETAIYHYEKLIALTPADSRADDAAKRVKKLKK